MPILKSRLSDVDIPGDVDLHNFLFKDIEECRNKTAITDDATGDEVTYGALVDTIDRLASAFHAKGIRKGDVVCVYAEKSIIGTAAIFALFKLGAVMTPCRPSHTPGELAIQLQDSDCKLLVADKHLVEIATAAVTKTPAVKEIFTIGKVDGFESVEELAQTSSAEASPEVQINPKEDLLCMIHSSGTTGPPKGVMLTHYNIIANCMLLGDPRQTVFRSTDAIAQSAPPYHMAGLQFTSMAFYTRKKIVLQNVLSIAEYLKKAEKYRIKSVFMLPNHLLELSKQPSEQIAQWGVNFSDLTLFTGGSPFNATNTREVLAKAKPRGLVQGYGSTDGGLFTFDDVDDFAPGSAGLVVPNTQIKIADLRTRETLGPHKNGEICVKGPTVSKGYFKNPAATADSIEDGWFKTGDVGYYDDSGHVFIVDRLKDVIKYKTMQVAPSEIEEVIYTHPSIAKVCVVPVEDDDAGEIPLACVILREGQTATEEEIVKLVQEHLAEYKRLRGGVKFFKEFPLTGLGKIIRRQLRDMVQDERNKNAN